jgi:misacylated tRNA(Ala) deacylase
MTELLYLGDHYLREFDARILELPSAGSIVLDRTALYPKSGGQPSDRGTVILKDGDRLVVADSAKEGNRVIHFLESPIPNAKLSDLIGQEVHCTIDWPLRYLHMRYHTALHILSGVVFLKFGARITGGQIYPDRARLDFSLSEFTKDKVAIIESEINRVVMEDHEVKVYWLTTDEAFQRRDMQRLSADLLPKGLDKLRVVDIVGFDAQLDGGTHVARTGEVGAIKITKTENKGRDNKRIEIVLV